MAASATIGLLRVLLTANSADFDAAMKKASDSAKAWSTDLKKIGQEATQVGSALTRTLTLPLIAVGVGAVKAATDFESSFAGVRKTVEATEPEFAALAQGLRDMAKEIPVNANELNKVAEAAGQLGIKKEDILQFTRTMADLGVTTNLTADEAATATAQIQNIFGAAGENVDRFGATLVALGNAGASTEKDIISMGLRIAGAGHQVGLTQDQVLAFASALSSVGINAEAGGSAISRVFLKINDAVAKGGKDLNEFARVSGMSSAEFKQAWETDAAGATVKFISGLKRIKGEGENVNGTLEGLVGKNIILKDTLLRASGAGEMLADTLKLGAQAWQDNTALTKEAEERYKTFASQLTIVWNQIRDVGITIGTALLPTLRDMLSAIQPVIAGAVDFARGFSELPGPIRTTALTLGVLVAAAGPAVLVLGQLALAGSALIGAFQVGGILATATIAIRGVGVAALAAAPQLAAFTVAAASVVAIGSALRNAYGLYTDKAEQARLETEQNKSHMLALAEASKVAGRAITDVAEANRILMVHTANLRAEHEKQAKAQAAVNTQTKEAAKDVPKLTEILANLRSTLASLTAEQRAQLLAGQQAGLNTKELQKAFNELYPSVGLSEEAIDLWKKQVTESTKRTNEAKEALDKFRDSVSSSIARWAPFKAAVQDAGQEIRNLRQGLDRDGNLITQSIQETADASGAAARKLREWADTHGELAPALRGFSGNLNTSRGEIQSWREALNESLAGIPATLARAFEGGGNIGGAFASIGVQLSSTIATSIMNGIELAAPQMRRLNSTISAGSAGAAAVGNAMGGQTAATIGSIAGSIGGAVLATTALGTAAATSATAALALGAATAGIGLAAVGVFMLAKHFLTVSKAVKEARADVLKFEDAIRDSLSEQQRMEAGGERWAEVLIGIRDAFVQTGRSAQEAERLTAQMWDTDNPDRAREAVAKIGVVFQELAAQQRMLAEGTEEANGIFQDLEAQAALMGNTMPDSLRPMIDRLVEMGVVTEETAERLGAIGNEGEVSIDAMKKAAEEFGFELDTLGPTFQQQRLTEEAQRILTGIKLLTAGGTEANVVLDGMQDELQAVVIQSKKMGTEIPENMRPYLQALVDSSELVDENGAKLTDLSSLKFGPPIADQWQIITDKLSLLIDKISAALPRALDEFALKTDDATTDASHNFGTVIGTVNALGTAIRNLPEIDVGDAPNLDVVPSYAIGSGGIRDFGTETIAKLHGREGVYTEAQIAAIRGGTPDVTVNTSTSDRALQEVLRMIRKLPRDLKISMREAIVMA